jgi:hypothetical protein
LTKIWIIFVLFPSVSLPELRIRNRIGEGLRQVRQQQSDARWEIATMIRLSGVVLTTILLLRSTGAAQAQVVAADPSESGCAYDGYLAGSQPYGGFGLEYGQPVAEGTVIVDRFGMFHIVSSGRSPREIAPAAPAPAQPRVRESRSSARRGQAQPRYQMPTGSLYWPGENSGILYSPAARYSNYGGGYGRGPYGGVDHSIMYKGWWLGY